MEVRVRERLIGALVLVAIVVLVVPSILKGREPVPASAPDQATRRVEVPIGGQEPQTRDEVLVPEPEAPPAPPPIEIATPKSLAEARAETPAATPAETPPETPARAPEKATAEAAPPRTTVAPRTSDAPAWAVQLGAFSSSAKAEQLVADLRKRGYSAFVLEYRATGKVLYRVRVGPEQDRARAAAIAERLAKDGFQPVVARHP